jgi:hypothetical protein
MAVPSRIAIKIMAPIAEIILGSFSVAPILQWDSLSRPRFSSSRFRCLPVLRKGPDWGGAPIRSVAVSLLIGFLTAELRLMVLVGLGLMVEVGVMVEVGLMVELVLMVEFGLMVEFELMVEFGLMVELVLMVELRSRASVPACSGCWPSSGANSCSIALIFN